MAALSESNNYPNRAARRRKIKFTVGKLNDPAWRAQKRRERKAHDKYLKEERELNEQKKWK